MPKTAKKAPTRKPVRARGAIPVPKTAPPRSRSAWYHRSGYQLIAIAVGIALIGTVLKVGGDWMRSRKEAKVNTQAVRKLDRKYQLAKSPLGDVLSAMAAAPDGVVSGKLSPPDLNKQADLWLAEFRKLDTQLRTADIPPGFTELDETRALLVQGNLVLIDAVKSLQLGATTPDSATRDLALKQGLNITAHGQNLVSGGETKLAALKVRFGVGKRPQTPDGAPESSPAPIQLPPEEAPTAPAGAQPGQAGAVPGQATTTLPVQPAP